MKVCVTSSKFVGLITYSSIAMLDNAEFTSNAGKKRVRATQACEPCRKKKVFDRVLLWQWIALIATYIRFR